MSTANGALPVNAPPAVVNSTAAAANAPVTANLAASRANKNAEAVTQFEQEAPGPVAAALNANAKVVGAANAVKQAHQNATGATLNAVMAPSPTNNQKAEKALKAVNEALVNLQKLRNKAAAKNMAVVNAVLKNNAGNSSKNNSATK